MPDLSDTLRKCRIGTAKNFTLLLLLYHTQTNGSELYSYQNGKIISQHVTSLSYIEKKGLFLDSGGRSDYYYDKVYSLKDGKISLLYSGEWNVIYDSTGSTEEYYWEGNKVSKDEYQQQLNNSFDESYVSRPMYDYDCDEIIDAINAY